METVEKLWRYSGEAQAECGLTRSFQCYMILWDSQALLSYSPSREQWRHRPPLQRNLQGQLLGMKDVTHVLAGVAVTTVTPVPDGSNISNAQGPTLATNVGDADDAMEPLDDASRIPSTSSERGLSRIRRRTQSEPRVTRNDSITLSRCVAGRYTARHLNGIHNHEYAGSLAFH